MSFSQKVNRLLKENKMTKASLAKISGIPYTTLDSMLKRETDTKRLEIFFKMAKALGTSVEELVFDLDEEKKVSPEERKVLELYSLLDSRGRNTVLSLMEREADNSRDEKNTIPVFDSPAAAGSALPLMTEDSHLEPRFSVSRNANFAIRIAGDSMEPLIGDGDLVYVEKTEEIKSGQIGVFILNGESLCKKYTVKDGETYLVSFNPKYEPIHVLESDNVHLVGRVVLSETNG